MPKEIHIWTDGSSINNGENKGMGGYGVVLLYGDFSEVDIITKYCEDEFTKTDFRGATETTNQREEIKSVIEGLKMLKRTDVDVQVFSDSAYVVNCMNDGWYRNWRTNGWVNSKKKPVENRDLWEELLSIIEDNGFFIKFNKIKGHDKIYYNEFADQLAKKGLDEVRGK